MNTTASVLSSRLPLVPSDLSASQRGALVAVVLAVHGAVAVLAMTHEAPTQLSAEPPAISVTLLTDEAPVPALQPPTPPTPTPKALPKPVTQPALPTPAVHTQPTPSPILASAKPAQASEMQVPLAAPESKPQPAATPANPAPAAAAAAASAVANLEPPRPPAQPKVLPSSAVRYLVAPVLSYPRASRDLGESGVVRLKILVDEQGRPKDIDIAKSSGFPRLDQEAIRAIRAARFQPYVEDGTPRAVWVQAPLTFNLEEQ